MGLRAKIQNAQLLLAEILAELPDDDVPPEKRARRKRGPRIVDLGSLPGPKPSPAVQAEILRKLAR